jgi:hypothetical protein
MGSVGLFSREKYEFLGETRQISRLYQVATSNNFNEIVVKKTIFNNRNSPTPPYKNGSGNDVMLLFA